MGESLITTLDRWEACGAAWRLRSLTAEEAEVELLSCTGTRMEVRRSREGEALRYLAARPSSEAPPAG